MEDRNEIPRYNIESSFLRAFLANIAITVPSVACLVVGTSPVTEMRELSTLLKTVLLITPLIACTLVTPFIINAVEKNGGKRSIQLTSASALVGMLGMTISSAVTDITKIRKVDLSYLLMLFFGIFIGTGSGTFASLINTTKWVTKTEESHEDKTPLVVSVFSSAVDFLIAITPVIIFFLKRYGGFSTPFALYSAALIFSNFIAYKFYQAPPYDQLRKQGYSHQDAKKLAIENCRQFESNIGEGITPTALRSIIDTLKNLAEPRILIAGKSMLNALGGFFTVITIFPTALETSFDVEPEKAIVISCAVNVLAVTARIISGQLITKYDIRTGGANIHILFCIIGIFAAMPLAIVKLSAWQLYICIVILNICLGILVITPLTLIHSWAEPKNKNLSKYNEAGATNSVITMGNVGGIVLPFILALMVDTFGPRGSQDFFYFIIAMLFTSAVEVTGMHYHAMQENLYNPSNTHNFFQSPNCLRRRSGNQNIELNSHSPGPSQPPSPLPGEHIIKFNA